MVPVSEKNFGANAYKKKVIDILNSNFGENYSIERRDDTHFSLTYTSPLCNTDNETIGTVTSSIPDWMWEPQSDDPDSVSIFVGVARNIYEERFDENERSDSN